jgi:hypothetical protein
MWRLVMYYNLPEIETLDFRHSILGHKQFVEALEAIKKCHKTSGTRYPRGMIIMGDSGLGKSTISETFIRDFPDVEGAEGLIKPILKINVPSDVSKGSLMSEILIALHDPAPFKGSPAEKHFRAIQLIKALKVEMIIFDDIHRVLPEYSFKKTQVIADELRTIQLQTLCPVILIGLESARKFILDGNKGQIGQDQLSNRLRKSITLKPFKPDDKEWESVLKGYMKVIDHPCIDLSSTNTKNKLWLSTKGFMGRLSNLLHEAIDASQGKKVTLLELSIGYEESRHEDDQAHNPFDLTSQQILRKINKQY